MIFFLTSLVFKWFDLLNSRLLKVQYSDNLGIWASSIWILTEYTLFKHNSKASFCLQEQTLRCGFGPHQQSLESSSPETCNPQKATF